jgi:hypothetical protein
MREPVLLFTSFGAGPHIDEVIFSASSAVLKRRRTGGFRVVIFTDDAEPFRSVDAQVVTIGPEQAREWAGPRQFVHRRKICALADALGRFEVPVVVVDGDTYFRKPAERLFERISPGHTLMHVCEGKIGHLIALGYQRHQLASLRVTTAAGETCQLSPEWKMWNAGIVGVHPADAKCVDRVLSLADAIQESTGHKNSEQIAFTEILSRNTIVRSCRDVVFHYHEQFIRDSFRAGLHGLIAQASTLPAAKRPQWLYAHRPKPPIRKKLTASVKRPLKRLGLFKYDLNTSI